MPIKTFILATVVILSIGSAFSAAAETKKDQPANPPHLVGVLSSDEGQPIVAPLPPAVLTGSAMLGGALLMKFFRKLRKLS